MRIYVSQRDAKQDRIREGGDAGLTGSCFQLPLEYKELAIVSQLGIEQQQQ